MRALELAEKTAFIEGELGPSLLVIKCHDILGDCNPELRRMAEQVSRGEMARLEGMSRAGFGLGPMLEQFLRTIYVYEMAGQSAQAQRVFSAMLLHARRGLPARKLGGAIAYRTAIATVLVGNHDATGLLEVLAPESFGAAIARAWATGVASAIEAVAAKLEEAIELGEDEQECAPWDDSWDYILLKRLRAVTGTAGDES